MTIVDAQGLTRVFPMPAGPVTAVRNVSLTARALANEPRLLLADEPTGELDQTTGQHIAELLDRVNADGTALVVVTHDPAFARRARRIVTMRDGALVGEEHVR